MTPVRREGYKFCQDLRVPCYQTNRQTLLKPAAFMDLAQEIAYWAASELGFGYDTLHLHHTAWVLSRLHIHFEDFPKWREDVSLYLVTYGHLPGNFVTKKEAEKAGWNGGSLEDVLPGKCIGGDRFGNREGLLPKAEGRVWTECDINTLGKKSRGPERLVFSNDGLIYYTPDHYESFTKLYG